ncbi:MAG TPA: putative Ig domain-containing protein, partial [Chitinophagaceae bacterium]|nr:putative Ig domain-containing protein [Chitinophagaceae bacterium]
AIGLTGESAYTATATATTQAAPPAPSAPTVLTAQVVSSTAINLSWHDNSNNETAFEIYRSTGNNTNFRLITTLTGGAGATKNYSDVGLFANVRYYYKVRAIGVAGNSAYTNEVNGKTLNTKPVLHGVLDFTVSFFAPYVLELNATDPDGDVLTFSSDNLPPFAAISNGTNGTALLTFTPGFGDMGGYVFAMYVDDANGGRDTTYLSMFVNENQPPTVNTINDITLDEGDVLNVPIISNDAEDPTSIGWTFSGLPSFVSFSHNGSGTGQLHLTPGYAASGEYNVDVRIDDGYGAWIMRHFKIIVAEKDPNEKILVSIKNATTAPAPWNNMGSQSISNLKNINGNTTTVGAAVQNSW